VPSGTLSGLGKRRLRWFLVRFLYRLTDILGKTQRLPAPSTGDTAGR